ncbi:hypothetical protein [Mycolicibacterium sp.]|uniref:hypothetical protein n=1 Tax=Mycolicibacterium sp. TaxID=2320850 RepID=UPI0037CBB8B4
MSEASHRGLDGPEVVQTVNLNPGVKDTVYLMFSVPSDIEPSMMVFRASSDSSGPVLR